MSTGVSIIGAGLSRFGRQPDLTGRELGLQAIGAALGRSPSPRACAASRRAQSWNVGQTGNALDRQ